MRKWRYRAATHLPRVTEEVGAGNLAPASWGVSMWQTEGWPRTFISQGGQNLESHCTCSHKAPVIHFHFQFLLGGSCPGSLVRYNEVVDWSPYRGLFSPYLVGYNWAFPEPANQTDSSVSYSGFPVSWQLSPKSKDPSGKARWDLHYLLWPHLRSHTAS